MFWPRDTRLNCKHWHSFEYLQITCNKQHQRRRRFNSEIAVHSDGDLDGDDRDGMSSSEAQTGLAKVELLFAVDCDASELWCLSGFLYSVISWTQKHKQTSQIPPVKIHYKYCISRLPFHWCQISKNPHKKAKFLSFIISFPNKYLIMKTVMQVVPFSVFCTIPDYNNSYIWQLVKFNETTGASDTFAGVISNSHKCQC